MQDDILDAPFHGCALAAFLDEARAHQGWPEPEPTCRIAYRLYEQPLTEKNARPTPVAPSPAPSQNPPIRLPVSTHALLLLPS